MVKWISCVLLIAVWALSLGLYAFLPNEMVVHWGIEGATRAGAKEWGAFLVPAMMTLIVVLNLIMLRAVRKIAEYNQVAYMKPQWFLIAPAALFLLHLWVLFVAMEGTFSVLPVSSVAIGLLLTVLSYPMTKVKPNFVFGLRTPWTFKNKEVWRRSNLLGGKVIFIIGLCYMIEGLFLPETFLLVSTLLLLIAAGWLVWYSYRLYQEVIG